MSKTYTDTEALEVLTGEGFDKQTVEIYIEQVIDAGLEIADQPDEGFILTADEVAVIRRQIAVDTDRAGKMVVEFDLVEVSGDNPRYEAADIDRIALHRNGEFLEFSESPNRAEEVIETTLGFPVEAVLTMNYFSGRRWTFELA